MNCASARCSRAAGPRKKVKREPLSLRAGLEVQAERRAQVDMVLRREVEAARRAPAPHLDVGRSRRRPPARSSCGRLGTDISISASSLWIASSRAAPLFCSSAMRLTSAISAAASPPLPLSWPICLDNVLRRACSSSVRTCSCLRSASSALKRSTSRNGCGFCLRCKRSMTPGRSRRSWVMSSMVNFRRLGFDARVVDAGRRRLWPAAAPSRS